MTRNESTAQILNSIAGRLIGGLLLIPAIPLAIVGMLAFNAVDGIVMLFVGKGRA